MREPPPHIARRGTKLTPPPVSASRGGPYRDFCYFQAARLSEPIIRPTHILKARQAALPGFGDFIDYSTHAGCAAPDIGDLYHLREVASYFVPPPRAEEPHSKKEIWQQSYGDRTVTTCSFSNGTAKNPFCGPRPTPVFFFLFCFVVRF